MKRLLLTFLAFAWTFASAQCPTWVGRTEPYAMGTAVDYQGGTYEPRREMDNGWIAPNDNWWWKNSNLTCDAGSSSSSSSNGNVSNTEILSAIQSLANQVESLKSQIVNTSANTFIDSRDGQTYKKVTIGSQTWMAQNLNYDAVNSTCYDNNPEWCAIYGRLYSLESALTICPEGWSLPSRQDWEVLFDYIDLMNGEPVGNPAESMKGAIGVNTWHSSITGNDPFGFKALPGGLYNSFSNGYTERGFKALFWSSTYLTSYTYARITPIEPGYLHQSARSEFWFSARCILD